LLDLQILIILTAFDSIQNKLHMQFTSTPHSWCNSGAFCTNLYKA